MTLLYEWLHRAADERGNNKALVYRDNYLSWRGLLHRVDRRAQEFRAMGLQIAQMCPVHRTLRSEVYIPAPEVLGDDSASDSSPRT